MTTPDLSEASDDHLIALTRQGRQDAWAELVRRYESVVFDYLYELVGRDRELAKRLTEKSLVNAWRALTGEHVDGEPALPDFGSWPIN